jgi:hypothetical protein
MSNVTIELIGLRRKRRVPSTIHAQPRAAYTVRTSSTGWGSLFTGGVRRAL